MRSVGGFVLPVPKKRMPVYRRPARTARKVRMDHGALDYRECAGDDLEVRSVAPFPRVVYGGFKVFIRSSPLP